MILIHKLVNGKIEASYEFADKKSAGAEYEKFQERLDCYAQVIVDGQALNTSAARKYFGLRKVYTPRNGRI